MEYVVTVNGSVVYEWTDARLARLAYVEYFHNANEGDVVTLLMVMESVRKGQPASDQE